MNESISMVKGVPVGFLFSKVQNQKFTEYHSKFPV